MEKKEKKINLVCKARLDNYGEISQKALEIAKKSITKGKEEEASEILEIVECYLSDSAHFEKQGYYVNAFACLNYAHGWLDCGARLKIFNIKNSKEAHRILSF